MENRCHYLDPNFKYTNKNGLLHNLANIEDEKVLLALEKGLHLNLNPADDNNVYYRYMKGTIDSDVEILSKLILELIY